MASQPTILHSFVGGPAPAQQLVKVQSIGSPAQIAATTTSAGWLRVDPLSGTGAVDLAVGAVPDGYVAGYYLGLITVRIPDIPGSDQYVPVAFALQPQ
jgi:hypothetical protein